jgi:hypothetical protein
MPLNASCSRSEAVARADESCRIPGNAEGAVAINATGLALMKANP